MNDTQTIIVEAFERRAEITPRNVETLVRDAVQDTIERLDRGEIRVAERRDGAWVVNDWIKKAVLLSFRIEDNAFIKGGFTNYYDKVPSKYAEYNAREFREGGVRVVPPAAARRGSVHSPLLRPDAVLRQHRGLCGLRHHGGHLGHRGLLRPDRQERPPLGRCGHRRCP